VAVSWVKVKNPDCSTMQGRRELFEARRDARKTRSTDWNTPTLRLREEDVKVSER